MDEKYSSLLESKKPITNKMLRYILSKGVMTGSHVFGGYISGKSDIDIIMPFKPKLTKRYIVEGDYGVWENGEYEDDPDSDFFECIYVKDINNRILNLLFFGNETSREKWVYATNVMCETVRVEEIHKHIGTKELRVELFKIFKWMHERFIKKKTEDFYVRNNMEKDDIPF